MASLGGADETPGSEMQVRSLAQQHALKLYLCPMRASL